MKEKLELFKKYGATGVLAVWLWTNNDRINKLEIKLENCYHDQIMQSKNESEKTIFHTQTFAILPNKNKKIYEIN